MTVDGHSTGKQSLIADIAAAFLLLSRIPIFWHHFPDDRPPVFMTALWAFPIVGLVIGAAGGLVMLGAQTLHLPPLFVALSGIFIMVMLSGAMHEDGLADMADGFGGGHDLESKIRIMHDSRIGTYGVLALILGNAGRIVLLSELAIQFSGMNLVALMALIAAAARFQPVMQLALFPISQHASLASLVARPGVIQLIVAALIWAVPLYFLLNIQSLLIMLGATLALSLWLGRLATRQVDGLTGDVMGAATIIGEIALMGSLLALMGYMAP